MLDIINIAFENIVIGVAAAAIVGLLTYSKNKAADKIVEKRFPIEGDYITTFEDNQGGNRVTRKAPAELTQSGKSIQGTTWLPDANTKEWIIQGEIHEDYKYINGVYHANNPRDEGVGNFFLYINSDGSMKGLWSGYDDENDRINSGKYLFQPEVDSFSIRNLAKSDIPAVVGILDRQIGRDYISVDLFQQSIKPESDLFTLTAVSEDESLSILHRIARVLFPNSQPSKINSSKLLQSQDTDILGFCIGALYDQEALTDYLNISTAELPEAFKVSDKIGVVRTVAVKEELHGQGIGTELVKKCIEQCVSDNATVLCSVGWKEGGSVNIGGIMNHFGFSEEIEIEEYWYEESIDRGYLCESCGEPPCTCSAVLFARYPGS